MLNEFIDKYGLIVSLGITIVLFAGFYGNNTGLWWDEAVYLSLARNVYRGDGYFINTMQESFRPPLLPAMAAGLWSLFGVSEAAVFWIPPVFGIMSVFATYLLAKKMFGRKVAFWSSLLVGTSFQFLFFGERFLTETLFVFLSMLSLLVFHEAVETKSKYMFPLTGLLIAMAFLTRYAGILLFVVYFMFPFYSRKKILKRWDYWLGVLVFLIAIIPWVFNSVAYYGSPHGALFAAQSKVDATYYNYPAHFYLERWLNIFGFAGLLIVPGIYVLTKRRKRYDLSILAMVIAALLFFMFLIERKEERYLLHYISLFYITAAIGIEWLRKRVKITWIVPVIVSLIIIANVYTGIVIMQNTKYSSHALSEAGRYLSGRVQENRSILSNNEPPLHYYTDRLVYPFPESIEELEGFISENNIDYIVIDVYEPTYPKWVFVEGVPSQDFDEFTLERVFQEYGSDVVWVFQAS